MCQSRAILNKRYVRLPLRDEVCADGEDRRGSAIDLGAVQAAFGAVHLHSTKPRQQQPSKLLRPLLLSTQSSLGHPRSIEIGQRYVYHSNIDAIYPGISHLLLILYYNQFFHGKSSIETIICLNLLISHTKVCS